MEPINKEVNETEIIKEEVFTASIFKQSFKYEVRKLCRALDLYPVAKTNVQDLVLVQISALIDISKYLNPNYLKYFIIDKNFLEFFSTNKNYTFVLMYDNVLYEDALGLELYFTRGKSDYQLKILEEQKGLLDLFVPKGFGSYTTEALTLPYLYSGNNYNPKVFINILRKNLSIPLTDEFQGKIFSLKEIFELGKNITDPWRKETFNRVVQNSEDSKFVYYKVNQNKLMKNYLAFCDQIEVDKENYIQYLSFFAHYKIRDEVTVTENGQETKATSLEFKVTDKDYHICNSLFSKFIKQTNLPEGFSGLSDFLKVFGIQFTKDDFEQFIQTSHIYAEHVKPYVEFREYTFILSNLNLVDSEKTLPLENYKLYDNDLDLKQNLINFMTRLNFMEEHRSVKINLNYVYPKIISWIAKRSYDFKEILQLNLPILHIVNSDGEEIKESNILTQDYRIYLKEYGKDLKLFGGIPATYWGLQKDFREIFNYPVFEAASNMIITEKDKLFLEFGVNGFFKVKGFSTKLDGSYESEKVLEDLNKILVISKENNKNLDGLVIDGHMKINYGYPWQKYEGCDFPKQHKVYETIRSLIKLGFVKYFSISCDNVEANYYMKKGKLIKE